MSQLSSQEDTGIINKMLDPIGRIKEDYQDMNTTRRRISDFILSNPAYCCFLSIRDFAEGAGCTDVTLMSYSKSLGYGSFADFRKALQAYVLEWSRPSERMKFIASSSENGDSLYKKIYEAERVSIDRTFASASADKLIAAASLIRRKKNVFVAAHNASRTAARYLKYRFLSIGVEVSVLDLSDVHQTISRIVASEPEETLLMSIATPPYGASTVALTRLCKEKGVEIIAFTDYEGSPLVPLSTVSFICPGLSGLRGLITSYVPFFAIFDALVFFYSYDSIRMDDSVKPEDAESEYIRLLEEVSK